MFYHLIVTVTGLVDWNELNKTRDEVLNEFICPFINKEITIHDGELFNMASFGSLAVYQSDRPIDAEWPVKKADFFKEDKSRERYEYDRALREAIAKSATDVTEPLYREALLLVESGQYREIRRQLLDVAKGRYVFFICPFEDAEIDHNYEFVIKPSVERHQLAIERVNEIAHTGSITEVILAAINRSRFVIADLTGERPNCYYELGYAHARAKPAIILAREGTPRHFDISTYKWNYWTDYRDLKHTLDRELASLVRSVGIEMPHSGPDADA